MVFLSLFILFFHRNIWLLIRYNKHVSTIFLPKRTEYLTIRTICVSHYLNFNNFNFSVLTQRGFNRTERMLFPIQTENIAISKTQYKFYLDHFFHSRRYDDVIVGVEANLIHYWPVPMKHHMSLIHITPCKSSQEQCQHL